MVLLNTSRAARFSDGGATSGNDVGPGTYSPAPKPPGEGATGGAVELQGRPPITRWESKFVTPGPGKYDVRRETDAARVEGPNPVGSGASAFRSNSERISKSNLKEPLLVPGSAEFLPSSIAENPGPGEYNQDRRMGGMGVSFAAPESEVPLIRGPAILSQTAPSFPLLRDPNDAHYTGRGPDRPSGGDYSHDFHTAMHTVMKPNASAPNFHASSTQRDMFPKPASIENTHGCIVNPTGPGWYEPRRKMPKGTSLPFQSIDPQCGTSQPFQSKSCSASLTPGPGSYPQDGKDNLDGHFSKEGYAGKILRESLESGAHPDAQSGAQPLAFSTLRSKSDRNGWWRPALTQPFTDPDNFKVPGPGHYPHTALVFNASLGRRSRSCMDGTRKKYLAVHTPQHQQALRDSNAGLMSAFSSTVSRGCMVADKHAEVAEVGTYDRNVSLGQSIASNLREPAKLAKKGAFGGTRDGERFNGFAVGGPGGRWVTPAPGEYKPRSPAAVMGGADVQAPRAVEATGGAFRSNVPQLAPDYSVDNQPRPGPGTYEDHLPFSATVIGDSGSTSSPSPVRTTKPKFRQARTDHVCFGSCGDRFGGGPKESPGPAEYDPRGSAKPAKRSSGAAHSTEKRGLEPRRASSVEAYPGAGVGPGQYDTVGDLQDKCQRTYNTSVQKAALELRLAAQEAAMHSGSGWRPPPPVYTPLAIAA